MTALVRSSVKSHLHENICCASAIASCIYCVGLYVGSHQEALVAPLLCCLIKFILTWYHTGWQTQCGEEMFIAGIVYSWVKLLELKCFDLLVLFLFTCLGIWPPEPSNSVTPLNLCTQYLVIVYTNGLFFYGLVAVSLFTKRSCSSRHYTHRAKQARSMTVDYTDKTEKDELDLTSDVAEWVRPGAWDEVIEFSFSDLSLVLVPGRADEMKNRGRVCYQLVNMHSGSGCSPSVRWRPQVLLTTGMQTWTQDQGLVLQWDEDPRFCSLQACKHELRIRV